jgi:hypothetical protein
MKKTEPFSFRKEILEVSLKTYPKAAAIPERVLEAEIYCEVDQAGG